MLHEPRVLFLDEPTIGLDPQTKIHVWDYIRKLNKEKNVTIFLTTRYIEEAEVLCNRVAIIDHGKIIAIGTPEELKAMIGSDIIYIDVSGSITHVCDILSSYGIDDCNPVSHRRISLRVKKASEAIPKIIRILDRIGVYVREISYRRPTLSDVFIHLIGREIRDEGGGFIDFARMHMRTRIR